MTPRPRNSFLALLPSVLVATTLVAAPAGGGNPPVDPDLVRELADRHAACAPSDIPCRLDLAAWAESRDLPGPAEAIYREAIDHDPTSSEARRGVVRLASQRPLELESAALDAARRQLGPGFVTTETRRFVVLSDADIAWTRHQAERLERTAHQFDRFVRRLGLDPLPLEHKLVCVLFADRAAYRAFARRHDNVTDEWIGGYYAPRHDRVVFYDGETNPSVVAARAQLARMQLEVDGMESRIRDARANRRLDLARRLVEERNRYRDHMLRERRRVDSFAEQVVASTTIHECVHQLLFHTRVQSPFVRYPTWICEGLATTFETDAPHAAFGPDHDYEPRRRRFEELLAADDLLPVADLAVLTELHAGSVVDTLYHQSYALVSWMNRFRARELRGYLEQLRIEPAGSPTPERLLTIFETAFGPAEELEAAWLRWERGNLMVAEPTDRPDGPAAWPSRSN